MVLAASSFNPFIYFQFWGEGPTHETTSRLPGALPGAVPDPLPGPVGLRTGAARGERGPARPARVDGRGGAAERRLSQQNLADQLGFSKSSVNMYERGEREPGLESMETIADYFNVDLDYLMGRSDIPNRNEWLKSINKSVVVEPSQPQVKFDNIIPISTKRFPLLGDIACGKPIMANEEKELYVEAGANIRADFCLKAKGDSMIGARIYDGDIVFIRKQEMVNNGEIAAVIIDDEATLKRVNYYPEKDLLILKAENSQYEDLVYTGEQLNHIIILGKAVAFQSDII